MIRSHANQYFKKRQYWLKFWKNFYTGLACLFCFVLMLVISMIEVSPLQIWYVYLAVGLTVWNARRITKKINANENKAYLGQPIE